MIGIDPHHCRKVRNSPGFTLDRKQLYYYSHHRWMTREMHTWIHDSRGRPNWRWNSCLIWRRSISLRDMMTRIRVSSFVPKPYTSPANHCHFCFCRSKLIHFALNDDNEAKTTRGLMVQQGRVVNVKKLLICHA